MGEFLFFLVIKPIWLLFEIIFRVSYRLFTNPGLSILSISVVMNILVLPMYLRSDAMQAEERKKQKSMEHWVKEIRRTFKGDERFMILSEYYRQNDYQPYYVLKSSLSLLLQVPFFIAAYDFLSNLSLLRGASFMMIPDLGKPDALIPIGNLHINLLPILMTAINLTSAAIYTKGGTKKEKIQTVAFALVFLVLLYGSPSGLVIYWTLNNIFSLGKNIVMDILAKHKKPSEAVEEEAGPEPKKEKEKDRETVRLWALSALLLAVFTGLSIPLSVIEASPMDFASNLIYPDPVRYALLTFAIGAGVFVLWGAVIFFLSGRRLRRIISIATFCCSILFIINHMMFSGQFGIISYNLIYDMHPEYDSMSCLFNVLFLIVTACALTVFCKKGNRYVFSVLTILLVCETVFSIYNIVSIEKTVRTEHIRAKEWPESDVDQSDINNRILKLSTKGKNVVVIMLDRSIGAYIPYIFNEKPEIEEAFSGFTFYPNTVSTGTQTLNASAAIFGGYEYTMAESNKRDDVLIKDKQNESLKLMPMLFSKEGYHSTLCDLPHANLEFDFMENAYIFDDIENCDTYGTMNGEYNNYLTENEKTCLELEQQKRNFFFYSLFRSMPLFAQQTIYDQGNYLSITSNSVKYRFITSRSFLRLMPQLTETVDDSKGEFIMMDNDTAHENTSLNPPDYEPNASVKLVDPGDRRTLPDGRYMDVSSRIQEDHYDSDMAAFIQLAGWLDRLRELGVYDNTRIIITSDHGFEMNQFSYMLFNEVPIDVESVNPVLLVKDYDAPSERVITDDTFMTNADVPTIAMKDIIKDPVNPFTGNPINSDPKSREPVVITTTQIEVEKEKDTVYDDETVSWFSVHDNIFDPKNWECIKQGEETEE